MNSRERLWAALNLEVPDRVPIWMLYPRERLSYYVDVHTLPSYRKIMPAIWAQTDWLDRRSIPAPPFYTAAAEIERRRSIDGGWTVTRSILHTPRGDLQYDDFQELTPDEMDDPVRRQIRDAAPGGGMILAPTAGPYAAHLTPRQQENTLRFIESGLRWGRYPIRT